MKPCDAAFWPHILTLHAGGIRKLQSPLQRVQFGRSISACMVRRNFNACVEMKTFFKWRKPRLKQPCRVLSHGIFSTILLSSAKLSTGSCWQNVWWQDKIQRLLNIKCLPFPSLFNSALLGLFCWVGQSRLRISWIRSNPVWQAP